MDLTKLLDLLKLVYPEHGYVSTAPADRWEDGMIIGNGSQGALCFSRPHDEDIVLSHESLFLPIYPKHDYIHLEPHMERIRELILGNRGDEAMRLTIDLAKEKGYLKRELTDPFIGACSLKMGMSESECMAYARSVDFETADSVVAWSDAAGLFHRRAFASRAHDLIAIELKSPQGKPVSVALELARIERDLDHDFYDEVVADTSRNVEKDFLSFSVKIRRMSEDQKLMGYCVGMRVVSSGGEPVVDGDLLQISSADDVLLLIDVQPEFAGVPITPDSIRVKLEGVTPDYDELLAGHVSVHSSIFNRVSFNICETEEEQIATEDMHSGSAVGRTSLPLIQKVFDAGRYGTICSTGKLPPALQGIWTGTWRPNWSGDFTLNGNVQCAVASALPGSYHECMRATLDYLSSLLDDFRTNARELFGFRGIYVPWRSSTHGQCHYAGVGRPEGEGRNAFPGMYWFAGTAWWAWFYYDYWLYTADDDFFEKQLVPYFLESADFYEDYLSVERDKKLLLVPSYSPENKPSDGHCLQPNATMTIAAIKQFFRAALKISDRMGVDDARRERWREILVKLPEYTVGFDGALSEWAWPSASNNEAHRHASHLYPLYDGVAPEIEKSPELQEACRVAIEMRLEYRRPKNGAEMSFGIVQLGMAATYLRDMKLAYECLEWLVNSYWSPAMVSQHNPGEILNLDISGGLPAVIINMLVQSFEPEEEGDPWRIVLLPCLPEQWDSGSIEGVSCRGGYEVSLEWANHKISGVQVTSERGEPLTVEYNGKTESVSLGKGQRWSI